MNENPKEQTKKKIWKISQPLIPSRESHSNKQNAKARLKNTDKIILRWRVEGEVEEDEDGNGAGSSFISASWVIFASSVWKSHKLHKSKTTTISVAKQKGRNKSIVQVDLTWNREKEQDLRRVNGSEMKKQGFLEISSSARQTLSECEKRKGANNARIEVLQNDVALAINRYFWIL